MSTSTELQNSTIEWLTQWSNSEQPVLTDEIKGDVQRFQRAHRGPADLYVLYFGTQLPFKESALENECLMNVSWGPETASLTGPYIYAIQVPAEQVLIDLTLLEGVSWAPADRVIILPGRYWITLSSLAGR